MDRSFLSIVSWVEEHQLEDYFDLQLQSESGSTTSELPTATEQLENADFLPGVQPLPSQIFLPHPLLLLQTSAPPSLLQRAVMIDHLLL